MPEVAEGTALVGNDGPLESYFFEAKVTFPSRSDLPYVIIRNWFVSPGKTRWEISSSVLTDPPRVLGAASGDVAYYEPGTNTHFTSKRAYDASVASEPFPLMSNYQVGYTAQVLKIPPTTRPNRTEELLGRTLEVHGNETPASDGIWIDRALGFVVKLVQDEGLNTSFVAEITRLAYNVPIEDHTFDFVPPAGSREVAPSNSGSSGSSTTGTAPAGFFKPAYLPDGYRQRGSGSGSSGGVTSEYTISIKSDKTGDELEIRELFRAGGPLPQQLQGDMLPLPGGTGHVSKVGDRTTLVVLRGDVTIYLTSTSLSVEELGRVAESMR